MPLDRREMKYYDSVGEGCIYGTALKKSPSAPNGGNFLINMGPDAEGDYTHLEYRRFKEFGEYVKAHPALMPEWPA